MGITKDYLRYVHSGNCGCVASINGEICSIDAKICAVTACENVNFYNMRTNEKVYMSFFCKPLNYVCFEKARATTFSEECSFYSSKDCLVKFWSIKSQSCFYSLFDCRSEIYSFSLLLDERFILVASGEAELLVYEIIWLKNGKLPSSLGSDEPENKKLSSERQTDEDLINDMANRYVRVNVRGKLLRQGKGRALQLAVSPDQRFVLCLGSDRSVDIYRVFNEAEASKRLLKKLKNARKRMAIIYSGATITEVKEEDVMKDITIVITRVGEYRTAAKMKWADFSPVIKLVIKLLWTAFQNTVHFLNVKCDLTSNTVSFDCISTMDQVCLFCISYLDTWMLMIWNTHSLRPVACFQNEAMTDVTAVLFTTGDGYVVAGTKSGELFLWDVGGCELVESRKGHEGAIWGIVHISGGKQIMTVSSDKKAKFWTYEVVTEGTRKRLSFRESRILEVPDEALCCAVAPDGKFVIIGLLDNTAAVYFADTLKFFISLYGHSLPVTCATVSPDSKLVVTGSADKSIKIWGLDFGDCHKSFHAHDDVVSAVLFSPSDEMLVWSAGRDGKIKQWDAKKMCRVQACYTLFIRLLGHFVFYLRDFQFSASHDKSLRCWELTEEIIVVEEEEEIEREKEYEARLLDEEDVVSGEAVDAEAGLATVKNKQSIMSAENIIEAIDILRNETVQVREDPQHKHPLLAAYNSKSNNHFVVDVISKCTPSNLERALLMVPLSYIPDILSALSVCVQKRYKVEFSVRVAIFLIRVHQNYVINSTEMLPVLEKIATEMPKGIMDVRDMTGFNLAALELLRLEVEEAQNLKLFPDISGITNKQKKKRKTRKALVQV
uniref:WD_REPEATS_REGION domain-containing protein n=1 Tax=Angiostrongylus cantonensis TaxID=6313 RepID=A0A158PAA6_ANGCA